MSAQKVYQQIVNEDNGGPQHVVQTPRDRNQVKNFQKEESCCFRRSHNAVNNSYLVCFQLQFNNWKGEPTDFLQHLQVYSKSSLGNFQLQYLAYTLIVSLCMQPAFDGERCVLLLCAWKPVFPRFGQVLAM